MTELVRPEDVLGKMVYAIANPVSSHLVDKVHHGPGVESLTAIDHDLPLVASKPLRFFDQRPPPRRPEPEATPGTIRGGFTRANVCRRQSSA